jgi:hypothetical protein
MHTLKNQQLETGSVIAFPWLDKGYVRASQLDWASLHFFQVEPQRLPGLVTLGEQEVLCGAAKRQNSPPRVFLADHPVSERFKKVCGLSKDNQFLMRLQLLHIFTEAMADDLKVALSDSDPIGETTTDARARMAELLKQLPTAALLDLTLNELVSRFIARPGTAAEFSTTSWACPFARNKAKCACSAPKSCWQPRKEKSSMLRWRAAISP